MPLCSIWDDPELSPKIRDACAVARTNGFRYIWIDSCCIDKSSSSELSEAINSMYAWYARAIVCYAYLADVPAEEDHGAPRSKFRRSRWFTRGWTLQELIAPRHVEFIAQDWTSIGSKHTLISLVEGVTGVNERALLHLTSLDKFSVSQRLSWASRRQTTRVEDQAYSLLGIFDINMPALYGEGERAFRRLQEEIMRRIPDQSLFAWGDVLLESSRPTPEGTPAAKKQNHTSPQVICYTNDSESYSILATRPSIFGAHSGTIRAASPDTLFSICGLIQTSQIEYTSTPYGIRTQFQVMPLSQYVSPSDLDCIQYVDDEMRAWRWYLAILGCEHEDYPGHLLGKICYIPPSTNGVDFLYSGCISTGSLGSGFQYPHLLPLSQRTVARCRKHIEVKTVHIPHPDPAGFLDTTVMPYKALTLVLLRETRDALARRGYTATLRGPDQDHPATHRLELSSTSRHAMISIEFRHALQGDGRAFTIIAHCASTDPGYPEDLREGHRELEAPDTTPMVTWTNESSGLVEWNPRLGPARVELSACGATEEPVVVHLGLDFAGMGFYLLRVDVNSIRPTSSAEQSRGEDPQRTGAAQKGKGGWARVFRKPVWSWLRLKSQPRDGLATERLKEGNGLRGT